MINYLLGDIQHNYMIDMFANLQFFDRAVFKELTTKIAQETAVMLVDPKFQMLHSGFEIMAWNADLVEYMVRPLYKIIYTLSKTLISDGCGHNCRHYRGY